MHTSLLNHIVLVDENDRQIGIEDKLQAHKDGKLHRAFSIFIFNSNGDLMLQKRDKNKYHSGGLWTNTCCSHPRVGESLDQAANRRLFEEMGFVCEIEEKFAFTYQVDFENGLHEHEYDHVFIGKYDGEPTLNPEEAEDWRWISLQDLEREVLQFPELYSHWIKVALPKLKEVL